MARNLVKENQEKAEAPKEEAKPTEAPKDANQVEVRVITQEQLIANNLEVLLAMQQETYKKMIEGFKQVGVKFSDEVKEK
jgi:hypothetical protein